MFDAILEYAKNQDKKEIKQAYDHAFIVKTKKFRFIVRIFSEKKYYLRLH